MSTDEVEYTFNIKESKLKDYVKIAIIEFRDFREYIMTKGAKNIKILSFGTYNKIMCMRFFLAVGYVFS